MAVATKLAKNVTLSQILDARIDTLQETSLVAQWIRLHTPNAGGPGWIPGQGTRSHVHATTKQSTCHS